VTSAVGLFIAGLSLSAFFSGCETGFYRATRVRWQLDALEGDVMARGLLWMGHNPAVFVATTLVGNNLANYITSLAIVLGVAAAWPGYQDLLGTIAPVVLTPVVFVYGELLPKNLFFQAPNRLLRLAAPLFLVFALLFLPVSIVLWLLTRVLRFFIGQAPEQLQRSLARHELQRVFDEGHDVGLLRPVQRRLAQGMLSLANTPLAACCVPPARFASVAAGSSRAEALRIAARNHAPCLLITDPRSRKLVGYVRVSQLRERGSERLERFHGLRTIGASESPVSAMMVLQESGEPWLRVVDRMGQTVGLVDGERLLDALLSESDQPSG
jgi:CBS domain containing-hemolysin-like protein